MEEEEICEEKIEVEEDMQMESYEEEQFNEHLSNEDDIIQEDRVSESSECPYQKNQLLDTLFSFMGESHDFNITSAGYFCKIISSFLK